MSDSGPSTPSDPAPDAPDDSDVAVETDADGEPIAAEEAIIQFYQ